MQQFSASGLDRLTKYIPLLARIMMGLIFILAAVGKVTGYAGTQGYMESVGLSGSLLPIVILFELACGLMLVIGFQARLVALLLAGFTLMTALVFHSNLGEQIQFILFMKNIAIAGGLLMVTTHGAGAVAIDPR